MSRFQVALTEDLKRFRSDSYRCWIGSALFRSYIRGGINNLKTAKSRIVFQFLNKFKFYNVSLLMFFLVSYSLNKINASRSLLLGIPQSGASEHYCGC